MEGKVENIVSMSNDDDMDLFFQSGQHVWCFDIIHPPSPPPSIHENNDSENDADDEMSCDNSTDEDDSAENELDSADQSEVEVMHETTPSDEEIMQHLQHDVTVSDTELLQVDLSLLEE